MRVGHVEPLHRRLRRWSDDPLDQLRAALQVRAGRLLDLALRRRTTELARGGVPVTPFVILATSRTGSTMLQTVIDSHPQARAYGELFTRPVPLEASLGRSLPSWTRSDPPSFLRQHVFFAEPGQRAVGFKLNYWDATGSWYPLWRYLRELPDLCVIHLRRRDRLARYVSERRAERDDVWAIQDEPVVTDDRPIRIDADEALLDFRRRRRAEHRARRFFADSSVLELLYEDLAEEPRATCDRVVRFLGLDTSVQLAASTSVRRTTPIEEEVVDYERIRAAVADERWADR